MSQARLPLRDIFRGPEVQFGQHWEAKAHLPIKDLGDIGIAIHAVFDEVQVADTVTVVVIKDASVAEIADYRVIGKDTFMELRQIGETLTFEKRPETVKQNEETGLHLEKVNGQFHVVDKDGTLVESYSSETDAVSHINRVEDSYLYGIQRGFGGFAATDRSGKVVKKGFRTKDDARRWVAENSP